MWAQNIARGRDYVIWASRGVQLTRWAGAVSCAGECASQCLKNCKGSASESHTAWNIPPSKTRTELHWREYRPQTCEYTPSSQTPTKKSCDTQASDHKIGSKGAHWLLHPQDKWHPPVDLSSVASYWWSEAGGTSYGLWRIGHVRSRGSGHWLHSRFKITLFIPNEMIVPCIGIERKEK